MSLSILIGILSAPALLGTQEAIRQSQSKEKREEHRSRRCNLIASCVKSSLRSREIDGRPVVLRDGKLWIDTGTSDGGPFGHPYAGYYLPYPDTKYEGLVTTITNVAPIMNWVYVDKDTYEVKYGVRLDAQPNLTGPFDVTRQDRRLTFDGWEGFCVVEETPNMWALYFDKDDDGLRSRFADGTRILEVELSRKEKRWKKDGEERQKDQTTKRAVETKGDAPVDDPVSAQPELNPPGVGVPQKEKAPEPLRPFGLPKSIFGDPPRPLFFGQEMLAPRSPPPAYYQEEPVVAPPVQEIRLPPPPEPEVRRPLVAEKPVERRLDTPPQSRGISSDEIVSVEAFETLRRAPAAPRSGETLPGRALKTPPRAPVPPQAEETRPNRSFKAPSRDPVPSRADEMLLERALETPPARRTPTRASPSPSPDATPLAPAPLQKKRSTPKLNRMSGTRAMSQAQMFEALAKGNTPPDETGPQRPTSRPASNATSLSNYSDPPEPSRIDEDEIFEMYQTLKASRPSSLAVPAMQERAKTQPGNPFVVADPAVFGRPSSGSSTTSDPAVAKDGPAMQTSVQQRGSARAPAPKQPALPPLPAGYTRKVNQGRSMPERGAVLPSRRQGSTSERDRNISPGQRRPSAILSRDTPRSTRTSVRPSISRESPMPRERTGSTSSLSRGESSRASPMSQLRPGERPSPRPSVASRTMTASARERSRTTTSGLYRDIDELVGTARNRAGSAVSNASSTRRNGSRDEDREPPMRRTVTSRDAGRNTNARSVSERTRDGGRGPVRRGERDGERWY